MAVAVAFGAGYTALRYSSFGVTRRPRLLLVAALVWLAYAAWEWLVQTRTPEADIRVDLLVLWPLLVALYRSLRSQK